MGSFFLRICSTRASAESPGVWFSDIVTTFPHIVSLLAWFAQGRSEPSPNRALDDTMGGNHVVTMSENHTPAFKHGEEAPPRPLAQKFRVLVEYRCAEALAAGAERIRR